MKLSELRPCDNCKGPLTGKPPTRCPTWYVIRTSQALVDARAAQQTMGLTQYFGGMKTLLLAEAMTPNPEAVVFLSDKNAGGVEKPDTWKEGEIHICFACAGGGNLNLCELIERLHRTED